MMRAVPHPTITEADVAYLLAAKKFIFRVTADNSDQRRDVPEIRIRYEIRRKDLREHTIYVQFFARQEQAVLSALPKPTPGISLLWYGRRIRGISRRIKHDVIRDGVKIGIVRGWYEHQWTNTDEDKYIVDINSEVKRPDLRSLIAMCLDRWNIERPSQLNLGI